MGARIDLAPLIRQLREDIVFRRIRSGLQALEDHRSLLEALDPTQENAAVLVGFVSQWVDIGFADPEFLRNLLARFPKKSRASLQIVDYVHLRMAEGLLAMREEEFDQATRHFQFVQFMEDEIPDRELLAISSFWMARCLRKEGRYDDARSYTVMGKDLALGLGYEKMAAVMQVLESWLGFQKGNLREAGAVLREAERVLIDTDDFASRGNIQSAYGRIARRQGRYDQALQHFEKSLLEYKRHDPQHMNLARALVNTAFVKRLIALRKQHAIDQKLAHRRSGASDNGAVELPRAQRAQIEELRAAALAQLGEAHAIYQHHHNHRGIGSVHINYSYLHLDEGDLDRASGEAAEAFRHGEEKRDSILMARARTLQCMVENARLEEQIDEDPGQRAHLAHGLARDAVEYARQTQNRQLLARALVWEGLTYCSGVSQDREAARRCCDAAIALLRPGGQESGWDDLESLKSKLSHSGQVDAALKEWSNGLTHDKTFQQITEEFANILIPRVWEREGRKISRVAARLSISPKKVRRILHSAGLLREMSDRPGGRWNTEVAREGAQLASSPWDPRERKN
jgi:tetratricopeptide (TPR) repeat protein